MFPHDPPCFLARTPYSYNDVDHIRRETSESPLHLVLNRAHLGDNRGVSDPVSGPVVLELN
jgi:hypothetical protein